MKRCKQVYYCNQTCQKKAWQQHKAECDGSLRVFPNIPTPTMRLLIIEEGQTTPKAATDVRDYPQTFADVAFLHDHADENEAKRADFTPQAVITKQFLGEQFDPLPINKIVDFLFMFSCNNFNISDGEMRPIGIGLYPIAALINHSCAPNAVAVFEGPKVFIRAIHPIEIGEEITISYIEVGMTKQQRQTTLAKHFFFVCECDKCQNEPKTSDGFKCPQCSGVVVINKDKLTEDAVCDKCSKAVSAHDDLMPTMLRANEIFSKAQSLRKSQDDGPKQCLEQYRKAISLYQSVLHPLNSELMTHMDEAMSAAIDAQEFSQAYEYCQKTLLIYESLQYYMHGKLANYMGHVQEAYQSLQRALKILYGKQHAIVAALENQLHETRSELESIRQ